MIDDPKQLVARGYDLIAARYLAWSGTNPSQERMAALAHLLTLLPVEGADVLELGCGAGLPVTAALAQHHHVVGVDGSAAQIALARQHVPNARFIQQDMLTLDLPPASFDAVAAFYSLIHIPRDELPILLGRVASWLRPGGILFATMGAGDLPGAVETDWLGAPMYWSHYDAPTNRALVQAAGFALLSAEVVPEHEDGTTVRFLWVAARRI